MRKVLLVGAGLALLAGGTAFAQTSDGQGPQGGPPGPPGGPPGQQGGPPGFQGGPPGFQGGMPGGPNGGPGGGPHGFDGHGPGHPPFMGPMAGPARMFMHMMRNASESARFHLRRGDAELDIKCSATEPMMACVNAANTLLDHVGQQHTQ